MKTINIDKEECNTLKKALENEQNRQLAEACLNELSNPYPDAESLLYNVHRIKRHFIELGKIFND